MNRIYLLFFTLLFLSSSCTSWLDLEPADTLLTQEAFQTPNDLESALTGVYHLVKGEDLAGRNWLLFSDLMSGNASLQGYEFQEFSNLQVHPHNTRIEALWTTSYRAINQLNQILASIETVAEANPGFSMIDQVQLRGESLFLRGVIYFELVQYFALPYSEETEDSLGVPLLVTPVLEKGALTYPSRARIEDIYQQIRADLTIARTGLPENAPSGKPSHFAATALLARLEFQQHHYEEADALASEVLSSYFKLTETPQDFFRNEGSLEEIWSAAASVDNPNYSGLNWAYGVAIVSEDLVQNGLLHLLLPNQQQSLDQAGYQAIDLRGYSELLTTDPLLTPDLKYSNKYEDSQLGDDAPMVRLAEMLLIRAEAAAWANQPDMAVSFLNQIRNRAFRILDDTGEILPDGSEWINFDAQNLTKEELLDAIARERRVELALEGNYLFDLLRRKADVQGLPLNHPRLRLPIPQREIDANPNLAQNPGY